MINRITNPKSARLLELGLVILSFYYCIFSQIFSMRLLPEQVEPFVPVVCLLLIFSAYGKLASNLSLWYMPLIALTISLVTHPNFGVVRDIVVWLIGIILITRASSPRFFKNMLNIFFYAGIVYAVSVLLQYIFPSFFLYTYIPLFQGEYSEIAYTHWYGPQHIATGLCHGVGFTVGYIVVAFGAYVFLFFRKTPVAQKVVILGLLILGLLMCKKRMHFAASILCALIVYVMGVDSRNRGRTTIFMIIFGVVMMLFVIMASDYIGAGSVLDRYQSSLELESSGESLSESRVGLRLYAFNLWLENPIFGIGWNQFKLINTEFTTSVHNVFLQLLCETGLVGAFLFLTPILVSLKKSFGLLKNMAGRNLPSSLSFSCFYQLFFFLYFFTGNPLYDYTYLIPYFIAVAISNHYSLITRQRSNIERAVVKIN